MLFFLFALGKPEKYLALPCVNICGRKEGKGKEGDTEIEIEGRKEFETKEL